MHDFIYLTEKEAYQRGWKSQAAWKRAGFKVPRGTDPPGIVYRKTAESRGLSFAGQPYIERLDGDIYVLPAYDGWEETFDPKTGKVNRSWVCNSWAVFSQDQVVPKGTRLSGRKEQVSEEVEGTGSQQPYCSISCASPNPRPRRKPRRRPQAEVVAYAPEGHPLPESITEQEAPFAQWFLALLYLQPLMRFRHSRWDHHVPCYSKFLEAIMGRDYRKIIEKLLQAGTVECDGFYRTPTVYRVGKALGYRLTPPLLPCQCQWRQITILSNTLSRRIEAFREEWRRKLTPAQRLRLRRLHRYKIDGDAARAIIPTIIQGKEQDWRKAIDQGKLTKTLEELKRGYTQQLLRQVEAIEQGNWYLKPDNYGREHSNITNLPKALRSLLQVDDEMVENVDTQNSQLLCLAIALKESPQEEQGAGTVTEPYCSVICDTETQEKEERTAGAGQGASMPYCSAICVQEEDDPFHAEVEKFVCWCEEGIYDRLAQTTGLPRERVKKEIFAGVLFNRERGWFNKTAKAFEQEFPEIRSEIKDMKRHGHQKVAHALQRIESWFMFDRVIPRLLHENPQMPFATIHDSILTTPHYSTFVRDVMKDEFRKLGINAKVRIESCALNAVA